MSERLQPLTGLSVLPHHNIFLRAPHSHHMDPLIFLAIAGVIGLIIGFVIGAFYGKSKAYQSVDISSQSSLLMNLNTQITEMKTKFGEIEKSRINLERERAKYDELREKQLDEWIKSTNKLFEQQTDNSKKSDEEKEKRIKELMDQTKLFFDEQKGSYEKFLTAQGKSREEIEEKRDAQINGMNKMIEIFTRTVSGTKQRGMMGEEQLKSALGNCIKAEVVKCNLKTDGGEIEFAWNLEDGNYIPIDCKFPDVFSLLDEYNSTQDVNTQRSLKRQITDKLKKEISRIQKYQNLQNTVDSCIMVLPEGILEVSPELVGLGREVNVFVCSYKDVFPVAYMLREKYMHLKEQGDIGEYKQIVESLLQIFAKIIKKTDAIERALKTIENANRAIIREVAKGRHQSVHMEEGVPEEDEEEEEEE